MLKIERTTDAHARFVARNLRPEDRLEMAHAGITDCEDAVLQSVNVSAFAFTAFVNEKPAAVFGLRPDSALSNRARLWLLGTNGLNRAKKEFVKTARYTVNEFLKLYPVLYNNVDARYDKALSLLRFLDARFTDRIISPAGYPFLTFEIRRNQ